MRFVSRLAATAAIGGALAVAPLASANPTHGFSNLTWLKLVPKVWGGDGVDEGLDFRG